jgi:hypothetical protein
MLVASGGARLWLCLWQCLVSVRWQVSMAHQHTQAPGKTQQNNWGLRPTTNKPGKTPCVATGFSLPQSAQVRTVCVWHFGRSRMELSCEQVMQHDH